MRSIEDHDLALARCAQMRTDKIVSGFLLARLLKSKYECSLRVHSAEDMSNDTILAGGVERLQHDEQRLFSIGVKQVLQLVQTFDVLLNLGQRCFMGLVLARVGGINF